jgi:hypothetical protein
MNQIARPSTLWGGGLRAPVRVINEIKLNKTKQIKQNIKATNPLGEPYEHLVRVIKIKLKLNKTN